MRHLGFCSALVYAHLLLVVFICFNGTFAHPNHSAKNNRQDSKESNTIQDKVSISRASTRGLPSFGGLTQGVHGLGLGLRRRRALSNKVTNKNPTDKATPCKCPTKFDPICASDGKTYTNKCTFQCEVKKNKSKEKNSKKPGKNSKMGNKIPAVMKVVKKGACEEASSMTPTPSTTTTTLSPVDMIHETATELTDLIDETITEHLSPEMEIATLRSKAFAESAPVRPKNKMSNMNK